MQNTRHSCVFPVLPGPRLTSDLWHLTSTGHVGFAQPPLPVPGQYISIQGGIVQNRCSGAETPEHRKTS